MIAVAVRIRITCEGCGQPKPPYAFYRAAGRWVDPDEWVQPCKACRQQPASPAGEPTGTLGPDLEVDLRAVAATAATLVTDVLELCEQALPWHTAVMLLVDVLDVLADPDEISQAGRYPPSPSYGDDRPESDPGG